MSSLKAEIILTLYGSETSNITNPFFLLEAPSLDITPIFPSVDTLTSFTFRASTVTVSIIFMFAGSVTSQK